MQLVLNTYGLQLSQRNHCFQIESKTTSRLISPVRITSILITKAANITSSAIMLAAENKIPVILVNNIGEPVVKIDPIMTRGHSMLRKKQYEFSKSAESLFWMMQMLKLKTEGHIGNLAWWANRKQVVAEVCHESRKQIILFQKNWAINFQEQNPRKEILQTLRGWEGVTARFYWKAMSKLAQNEGWNMQGRNYRPALDGINTLLNYLYGMMYHQVELALASSGLDSQVGIWHADEYQTPSLSFDVIEPLRPKVDYLIVELLIKGKIQPGWFEEDEKYGYILNKKGKDFIIPVFNDWLEEGTKMQNHVTQMKNHILQQANNLKQEIEKCISDE